MNPPFDCSAPRAAWAALRPILVLALLSGAGCTSTSYQAARLPPELQAPPVENPQTIDLSRLASFAVSSELIDRGDVLELSLVTGYGDDKDMTVPIRVADDGTGNIPLVGKVELAGLELEAAERAIAGAGAYRGVFHNAHVTVTMRRQRTNRVTVLGAVESEGVYELPRNSSALLQALVAAGGLSEDAGTEVEIRRPQRGGADLFQNRPSHDRLASIQQVQAISAPTQSVRVNLVTAAKEGRGGYVLDDGDVVMVQKRDPKPVHVIGLVKKAGQYELPVQQEMRVLDAVALAGGLELPWADKVMVIRQIPGQSEPVTIEVSIREAKRKGASNLRLAPGDVVSIEQTPATVLYDAIRTLNFGVGASLPVF